MKGKKKISDITMMVIAMILGSIVGLVVGEPAQAIGFVGDIWLNMMKMFLVPIVVCMLVKGISSMDSPEALGRIGIKIVVFYIVTTICASLIGIGITSALNPGKGFQFEIAAGDVEISEMPTIGEFFKSMFSSNIFKTFTEANMMQVVILSCIIGVAIVLLPEEKRQPVRGWFIAMTDLMISIIKIALKVAPIGVFCLMASTLGKYGAGLLITIAKILAVFYSCCALHLIIVYCLLLWGFTGITPLTFLKKAFPTFATAVSTCSSNAVVPVSMDVATENFGCDNSVAGLGIPLGATINKDGVAILCGVVLVFSAQAMNIPLTASMLLNLVFVTTLVTSAGSGVPGGGLMNLMIVGAAIGIPLDIVIMVGGFYRFFDMGTTSMNCLGDMSATVIIDRLEKRRQKKSAANA